MTVTRFHVVAIAAGLLLPISEPSFAAHQTRHPSGTHSWDGVKKNRDVVAHPYDSSRVSAFGSGYNFPYPDRPYGGSLVALVERDKTVEDSRQFASRQR
jgi:hypothetical protein